jgi:hypothetical protein
MTRRRAHERYNCEVNVTVIHQGVERAVVADNVSLGGMFLCTDASLPLASEVVVRFEVPGSGVSVEAGAVVRWHKPAGFGVQFGSLRAREVWALNRWFARLSVAEQTA